MLTVTHNERTAMSSTATATRTISKTIRPGMVPEFHTTASGILPTDVFCKIEYDGQRLSISGVIGPRANGDAWGSSGQIGMGFAHRDPADNDRRYSEPVEPDAFEFATGWDASLWLDFLDVWSAWHLNDLNAADEHQRALGWDKAAREERTIYHWRLNADATKQVREGLKIAEAQLRAGEAVKLPYDLAAIAQLPDRVTTMSGTAPGPLYVANGPQYEGDHYNKASEVKTRGWLKPSEHPDGLLGKACPECGYAYGTAWKTADVPAEVLDFLESLPSSTKAPAWV